MTARKPGKPALPAAFDARARAAIERLFEQHHRNRTSLGKALGISQPAVTQILDGGGISYPTAMRALELAGDLEARNALVHGMPGRIVQYEFRYDSLRQLIEASPGKWPRAAIVAAEDYAGDLDEDPGEAYWPRWLDRFASAIELAAPPKEETGDEITRELEEERRRRGQRQTTKPRKH